MAGKKANNLPNTPLPGHEIIRSGTYIIVIYGLILVARILHLQT
jgi:hypothetical protein